MQYDPFEQLNRPLTDRLANFYAISPEDDEAFAERDENPEYQAVEEFLKN